ncbi:hypothetical protein G9A89_006999 [Geosiphon pyriformis]|nr:hypothetical protein G9A89_006999 [Geosiphon pyriformis]
MQAIALALKYVPTSQSVNLYMDSQVLLNLCKSAGNMRNTSGNCKDSLREDFRQWVDFSLVSEKKYINTHNNQKLRNNLYCDIKEKAFNITKETKVATKTPNLTVFEFCHAIYTQNQSDFKLPEECCLAKSAFTYYINAKINYYIRKKEEPHNAKLGLYKELSQYITKEVAVIAAIIVKIHQKIEQYANKNFLISTGNTRKHTNKIKENLETNQEKNKSYYFSLENKIQILLGAVLSLISTPQMPRTPTKIWNRFKTHKEKSESESKKKTSKKTITRPVTGISSQSKNQETYNQEKELDIREATFKNTQRNIILSLLRPISPPAENGNEITTPYITRLTDFSGEEEEMDMHINQRATQTLPFFLKGTANLWYQSLKTKPTSFVKFKNALLEYFSNPNQGTGKTVTQYLARFNQICCQIKVIEQKYYTNPQVLNQFIRGLKSSILGRVCSAHPNFLPEAIMLAKALESAEKEANHSQIVNMVMEENKTKTLEKRVMQLGKELSKKIESYLIPDLRKNTYQPPQKCSQEVSNKTSTHQYHTNIPPHIKIKELTTHVEPKCIGPEESKLCWNQNNDGRNINRTKNSFNKLSQTIPPAVATEDSSLTAIFPFKLEKNKAMFNEVALDKKHSITAMYTKATVNNTPIKLILNSRSAGSIITLQLVNQLGFKVDCATTSQIIIANESTKLSYGKIDSFSFKINTTCGHFQKPSTNQRPIFGFKKNLALPAIKIYQLSWADNQRTELLANQISLQRNHQQCRLKLECSVCKKKLLSMTACSAPDEDPRNPTHYYCNYYNKEKYGYPERHGKWDEELCLTCGELLPRGCDWNNIPGRGKMCNTTCQYTILICNWVREGMSFKAVFNRVLKRLQHYSHNENESYNTAQAKSAKVTNKIASYNMFNPVDEFQDYYQQLCPTQQEQKQYLAQINTYLYENYEKDLERKMEIENQQSQNQSINQQDLPDDSRSKKFVAYTDLEQIINIQYFDNRHLEIIPKRAHPTNAKFDLCYPKNKSTTLSSRSITKIDLKIVVKILPETMIQIALQLSLVKKGISIQKGVIDSKYTGNLMVLLQNNSKKPYTIESKEKIAQAIFLPLVKIGKFVPVENCEELLQIMRGTFGFGSTEKGIEANFAETIEKKGKVIKTEQFITLLSYEKSEIKIKRTIKEKDLIFEPYPETCQQIPITNTTEKPIYILEDTIIGYLATELENASTPQEILNFPEIALYCELTSINWQQPLECY